MGEGEWILELLRGGPSSLPHSVLELADSCARDSGGGGPGQGHTTLEDGSALTVRCPQRRLPSVTRSNGEVPIHDTICDRPHSFRSDRLQRR